MKRLSIGNAGALASLGSAREYTSNQTQRIVLYHLRSQQAVTQAQQCGFRLAQRGETIALHPANDAIQRTEHGAVALIDSEILIEGEQS